MQSERTHRKSRSSVVLWTLMIVGTIASGAAFIYKIAEFIYTIDSRELEGFADVPVTVYFIVATGWLALLVWCFVTGQFQDVERTKYEMLHLED